MKKISLYSVVHEKLKYAYVNPTVLGAEWETTGSSKALRHAVISTAKRKSGLIK